MPFLASFAAAALACVAHGAILGDLADTIERRYVLAAQGSAIAAQVRRWRDEGRYAADCGNDAVFLDRLNRDLDAYDGHFHVERAGAQAGDDWLLAWRSGAAAANAGVREVSVMEGNIGYLRIASFYPWDLARDKYRAAWRLLSDVSGLVIDLRQNGGGDGASAAQLVRAALGPALASVQSIESRGAARAEALAPGELPALAPGLPIVVLVDRRTASAAEFVAYTLQQEKRARIVGMRSAGAAHMFGPPLPLRGGMQAIVPDARPLNRLSATSWEGAGVRPDAAGGDDPLFVARRMLAQP